MIGLATEAMALLREVRDLLREMRDLLIERRAQEALTRLREGAGPGGTLIGSAGPAAQSSASIRERAGVPDE